MNSENSNPASDFVPGEFGRFVKEQRKNRPTLAGTSHAPARVRIRKRARIDARLLESMQSAEHMIVARHQYPSARVVLQELSHKQRILAR